MTDNTATASSKDSLTVRDNRTGEEYDVPILDGAVRAADLGKIRTDEDSPGLAVYDPGFVNTAPMFICMPMVATSTYSSTCPTFDAPAPSSFLAGVKDASRPKVVASTTIQKNDEVSE